MHSNGHATVHDVYVEIAEQYNVHQTIPNIARGIAVTNIARGLELQKKDFADCMSLSDIIGRINELDPQAMTALRTPDELQKLERGIKFVIKSGRIKPK